MIYVLNEEKEGVSKRSSKKKSGTKYLLNIEN